MYAGSAPVGTALVTLTGPVRVARTGAGLGTRGMLVVRDAAPSDSVYIDYAKLTRMAQWMYLTGWFVANAAERPKLDPGFELER